MKILSDQVNAEYYSAYLYLAMSAYADNAGYKGVANWLYVQAQEEMAHGSHIYKYILERGGAPAFSDVKAPRESYGSISEIFEKALAHERHVTELINKIADFALKERDHATYNFILWYVTEQIEEESSAGEILEKVKRVGDNPGLLHSIDAQLAARVFNDPFAK
ncbi:MAG: ferritin [Synergistaceae bacterium]|nr:ferritin [Synergistaceae bacterium]